MQTREHIVLSAVPELLLLQLAIEQLPAPQPEQPLVLCDTAPAAACCVGRATAAA